MKILVLTPLWGHWGGRERYITDCIVEFTRLGHVCSVVFGHRSSREAQTPLPAIVQYELPAYSAFHTDSDTFEAQQLCRILDMEKPDAIFMADVKNFALLSVLQQYGRLVPMSHDNWLVCMRTSNITYFQRKSCTHPLGYRCLLHGCVARKRQFGRGLVYNSLSTQRALLSAYRNMNIHLVPSNYTRDRLLQHGFTTAQVKVVGYFSDVQPLATAPAKRNERTVVFVGRIDRYKGLDYLLHSLALVPTPFRFTVIGDGQYLRRCRKLADSLGLTSVTEFAGWLPREDILVRLCQASLLVMPSILPESFGLAGVEAMLCSTPVVAFDSGGISDWLKDGRNGYLVPVKNIQLLATRIDELLRTPDRAVKMGENGRHFVSSTFGKEKHVARLVSICETVS